MATKCRESKNSLYALVTEYFNQVVVIALLTRFYLSECVIATIKKNGF